MRTTCETSLLYDCTVHVHPLQSRLTGKRPMTYLDDDSDDGGGRGEEISFTGTSRSKKAKTSDTIFDMVDVSLVHCTGKSLEHNPRAVLWSMDIH